MSRPRSFHRLFLAGLVSVVGLVVAGTASAGESAELIWSRTAVWELQLSPDSKWVAASVKSGSLYGVQVQRIGSGKITTLISTKDAVRWIRWMDADTLLAGFATEYGRRILGFDIGVGGGDLIDRFSIDAPGSFVDALPAVEDEVLWELEHDRKSTVYRVSLEELRTLETRKTPRGRPQPPRRDVATVGGSATRWVVDREGVPRATRVYSREQDRWRVLTRSGLFGGFQEVYSYARNDEAREVVPVCVSPDGRTLIVTAYGGHDTKGLHEFDAKRGEVGREVFRRPDIDVVSVVVDPETHELIAAVAEPEGVRRYFYLDEYRARFEGLLDDRFPIDSVRITAGSPETGIFLFRVYGATEPGVHYFRNANRDETVPIARIAAELDRDSLAKPVAMVSVSTDDVEVESFLTRPRGTTAPAPLVVLPHGGPYGIRDSAGYDPLVQYLASWGFAVLQPNFRGSSGYGLSFLESGQKEWARGIEDDIDAAVRDAVARPGIDGSRICIVGGSYGGFSALASVARHRDRYRCAVSINGVSDIPLLGETADFSDSRRVLESYTKLIGSLETERDKLLAASPVYHVDDIETPVFLIYGDRDRRVDPEHSLRMMAMFDLLGKPYEFLEIEGMYHGPDRLQWVIVSRALRRFLSGHLMPDQAFEPDPRVAEVSEAVSLDLGL